MKSHWDSTGIDHRDKFIRMKSSHRDKLTKTPPTLKDHNAMETPQQLTLVDMFACHAMQSLITLAADPDSNGGTDPAGDSVASSAAGCGWGCDSETNGDDGQPLTYADVLAGEAFEIAGAMMRARARSEGREKTEPTERSLADDATRERLQHGFEQRPMSPTK